MSISVDGNVYINGKNINKIPIKFKEVYGNFHITVGSMLSHFEFLIGQYRDNIRPEIMLQIGITSLENCPDVVSGVFFCGYNNLKSLEFCPRDTTSLFFAYTNISSFDGLPEFFESEIILDQSPLDEIYSLFNKDPKCIDYIREFDVIRGNTVIRNRLEEVFIHMGMKCGEINLKNYKLV